MIAIAVPATISARRIHSHGDVSSEAAGDGDTVALTDSGVVVVEVVEVVELGDGVTVLVAVVVVVVVVVVVFVCVDVVVSVDVSVDVEVLVADDVEDVSDSLSLGRTDCVGVDVRDGVGSVGMETDTLGIPDGNRDETAEDAAPHAVASEATGTTISATSQNEGRFIPTRSYRAVST